MQTGNNLEKNVGIRALTLINFSTIPQDCIPASWYWIFDASWNFFPLYKNLCVLLGKVIASFLVQEGFSYLAI